MNYFQLLKKLNDIYDSLTGKKVDKKFLVKKIRHSIPFREVKIVSIETLSLPYGKFTVSGLYDPDRDEQGKPPITVEIAFPKNKIFQFDEQNLRREHWAELCMELASILGHEFVHLQQFRKRNFEWCKQYISKVQDQGIKEIQEYYGDKDEIGAYAFMAATQLSLDRISMPTYKFCVENTNLYKTYTSYFEPEDPVVREFVKLTYRYTKKLEKQYHDTTFD
jgi:hypothetical protein